MLTQLKSWLWLTERLDAAAAWQAVQYFGSPEKVYFADPSEYTLTPGLKEQHRKKLADKSLDGTDRILAECERKGIGILTWQDAEYPERLRNIDLPPLVLYYRGRLPRFDEEIAIAMAGTRKASPYGRKVAGELAYQITRLGGLVLTGIVDGCDRHAADGALKAGGPLICVLAGGVDVPYYDSDANRNLLNDAAACGAVISEYPPGTPHLADHFLARNRILTGLSVGAVCVEAPVRSGTLNVALLALEQGRDVYAVPANIDAPAGMGTNQLLTRGEAICVCSGADVLEHYWAAYPQRRKAASLDDETQTQRLTLTQQTEPDRSKRRSGRKSPSAQQPAAEPAQSSSPPGERRPAHAPHKHAVEFTDDELAVLRALTGEARTTDEIVAASGLPARRVSATLTVLTIRALVRQLPGGRFEAAVQPEDI